MFWFTGDSHFNHKKILEYDNRPFKSIEHMDREIIRRWNERVKIDDTIIHFGDFGFFRDEHNFKYYRTQLNGNLILLKGNHEEKTTNTILTCAVINYGGIDWWCEHHPTFKFEFNLCAHVHRLWKISRQGTKFCINVGVTEWNYQPISIEEILQSLEAFKKSKETLS